ncbi:sugar kinase [Flavihumibacter sp. RY-1]|uniref:Sugar kinase n=1 Tax=Flavihumibacter fluminis TaxID=2909236 RepID=A0ABS9BM70_9BACT|nr:sugar kinase [Flavihumibacter fluminis]MCF1716167.1 sugar kinase [Flavihumibacter fluminis]
MKTKKVLAIGEALIDAVSTEFVEDLSSARQLDLKPGGSPANFCRFLHQLGTPALLHAVLGADGLGKIILNDLREKQIDCSLLKISNEHATSMVVVGKTKGTPDFIPYRDADMQIGAIDPFMYKETDLVHTTAFALSREPAQTNILTALHLANRSGKQISVDWNYSPKIWGPENFASTVFSTLLSFQPLLKCSLDDIERFTNKIQSIESAKDFLHPFTARVTCLTCGSEGVWFKTPEQDWQHRAAVPVEVKDSTGAGDSFWAGFVHAWLTENSLEDCIQLALDTAARRLNGELD